MNLSAQFKEFLLSQASPASKATIKNYISDLNKFTVWFENKFNKQFAPNEVSSTLIKSFKSESLEKYSASSVDRNLSTLRKFFTFLKLDGQISHTPFEQDANESAEAEAINDPWRIKDFKNHLYVFNASHLTIKNYVIDVKQFTTWAETVLSQNDSWDTSQENVTNKIDSNLVQEYKKRLLDEVKLSPVSVNRKLSSLRKYISWAQEEGIINSNIQVLNESKLPQIQDSRFKIQEGEEMLLAEADHESVTNPKSYSSFPPLRLLQKTKSFALGLVDEALILPLVSLLEKIQYQTWTLKGKPVFFSFGRKQLSAISHKPLAKVSNVSKSFYAPALVSTKYFPLHKKIWYHARNTRPEWYKRYRSYSIANYFNFAILALFVSVLGYAIYSYVNPHQKQSPSLAAGLPNAPSRILSFQGRLTDNSDNPITTPTWIRFEIYNTSDQTLAASNAGRLWEEVRSVTPDNDGIFSVTLGGNGSGGTAAACNGQSPPSSPATGACGIMSSLFANNSALWLGVTVGWTPELSPRQQIATVAFATDSEFLQGMPPITNATNSANVVLALNSSGNLSIGNSSSPTFQATGGTFTIAGQIVNLNTNVGSAGNIQFAPDGLGKIDLQKPLQNTTLNNNVAQARGSLEVDDSFSVLGTTSASLVTLEQKGSGPLISASVSGTAKFTVDNSGNITTAGTALTFTGTAPAISVSTAATGISLEAGTTGIITIGGTSTGGVNIGGSGTGDINLAGGTSSGTGCTITNATGALSCNGDITGATTGTAGYWKRGGSGGSILSPATSQDQVSIPTNAATALTITQSGAFNAVLIEDQASDPTPFVIDQSGQVGVGNSAPAAEFTVGSSSQFQVNVGGNITFNQGALDTTISINNGQSLIFNDGSNPLCTISDVGTTGNLSCTGTITGPSTGTVGYWTRSGTNLYDTNQGDKVGIGTTNPALLLSAIGGATGYPIAIGGGAQTNGIARIGTGAQSLDFGWGGATPWGFWIQAQLNTNTSAAPLLLNPNGGNVTIGTTVPAAILDVQTTNGDTTYTNNVSLLRLANTSNGGVGAVAGTEFEVAAASDLLGFNLSSNAHVAAYNSTTITKDYSNRSGFVMQVANGGGGAGSTINFATAVQGSTTLTSRLYVDGSGNVGIGTTAPYTSLDVGAATGTRFVLYHAASLNTSVGFGIQSNLVEINGGNTATDFTFGSGTSGSMTRVMTIEGTGNVGIGINAPTATLHVVGPDQPTANTAAVDVLRVLGGAGSGGTTPGAGGLISLTGGAGGVGVGIGAGGTGGAINLTGGTGGNAGSSSGGPGGALTLSGGVGGTGSGTNNGSGGIIAFKTSLTNGAGVERMRIEDHGSIGMGTAAPISELHVTRPLSFGANGTALVVFNQIENQDIFTASASGTTRFKIANNGTASVTINDNNGFFVCKSATSTGLMTLGKCSGTAAQTDITEAVTAPNTEAGDIVEFNSGALQGGNLAPNKRQVYVKKAENNTRMAGVISTWGIQFDTDRQTNPDDKPLTTAGVIPVKVNLEGGIISRGDPITASSIPGVGMKAAKPGFIIGRATEDYDGSGSSGRVLTLLNLSWYDPDVQLADSGNLTLTPTIDNNFEVKRNGESFTRIGAFSEVVSAKIRVGLADIQTLTAQTLTAVTASFGQLSTNSLAVLTDNITIAGQSIRDFISGIVDQRIAQNGGNSNILSPLETEGSNIAIKLKTNDTTSKFIIKNASGSAVASIDGAGNASLSGNLTSNGINTNEATIAGTLHAKKIIADSIEGLNLKASTVSANYITNTTNNYYIATPSAQVSTPSGYLAEATGSANFSNLFAKTATFEEGLMSFGPSSFFEASIADRLFVGSQLSIADNSINVLGGNLQLQPMKQGGVDFEGGLIAIDNEGNLKVNGKAYFAKDVEIHGSLFANIISPLPGKDLILELPNASTSASQIAVRTSSGSALLSINNKGDLNASGTATFNKLNLTLVPQALAVSDTEVIATGSAGVTEIKPYQTEVTIDSPLVTANSLIYVTPKTSTPNQSVYLLRQVPGVSFTVGLSNAVNKKVPFNWIIIN